MQFSDFVIAGDAETELSKLPNSFASTVITSPPYWGLREYGGDPRFKIGNESSVDDYISSLVSVFSEVKRTLRDDGVLWLIIGDTYTSGNRTYRAADKKLSNRGMTSRPRTPLGLKDKELVGLPWRLAFALQSDGWHLRSDIIWAKPNPMPESVKDRPHRSHEYIFMLTKQAHYYFDWLAFKKINSQQFDFGKTIWTLPVGKRRTGHPATFPIELTEPCILSSSKYGGWVLDPFAGSGSVGISSTKLGRKFIGIELVDAYAKSANESIKDSNKQSALNIETIKYS
jgi:site-specific DNA-methyltransferase (adenine-specific)